MSVHRLDTEELRRRTCQARVDRYLAGQGFGFNPYLESRARIAEVERLYRMSDADLAGIGLSRDDILPHVFADAGA